MVGRRRREEEEKRRIQAEDEERAKRKAKEQNIQQKKDQAQTTRSIMASLSKLEEREKTLQLHPHPVAALPQRTRDGTRGVALPPAPSIPTRPVSVPVSKTIPPRSVQATASSSLKKEQEDWAKKHMSRGIVDSKPTTTASSNVAKKTTSFEQTKKSATLPTGLQKRFAWE